VEAGKPFDCSAPRLRQPQETKGHGYKVSTPASQCCDAGDCG